MLPTHTVESALDSAPTFDRSQTEENLKNQNETKLKWYEQGMFSCMNKKRDEKRI